MTLEELKRRKNEMGYTYAQMARMTGVPLGTIQKIFTGETANPRYDTMQALEQLFEDPDMIEEKVVYNVEGQDGYTVDDYYALPDEQRVELIDGYFYDMSSFSFMHQDIVFEIGNQIRNYVKENNVKCKAMISPVDVRLDCDDKTMIQPDLVVLCDLDKIRKWGILGAPDLIIEVTSSSTRNKDYAIKAAKYMKAKVREYWIIDPYQKKLIRYEFENDGEVIICELDKPVPVGIFEGKLKLNFEGVLEIVRDLENLED